MKIQRRFSLVLLLWITFAIYPAAATAVGVDDLQARTQTSAGGKTLSYRLFVPAGYDPAKKYPLVVFLHGAGQRGHDNRSQLEPESSPLFFVQPETQAAQPCFFIAPQCPDGQQWVNTPWGKGSYSLAAIPISDNLQLVLDIIRHTQKEFSVDPARLYLTGLSMGGYGTWDLIERNPRMFAAAVPICGAGDPSQAAGLKGTGLWAFHSTDDGTVPVSGSRDMIRALWASGRTPCYTEYAGGGHDAWFRAYATPGLAAWLFSFHNTEVNY